MHRKDGSTRLLLAAIATASALLAGCSLFQREPQLRRDPSARPTSGPAPSTQPMMEEERATARVAVPVPGVLQAVNRPILQGPLPLIYLVESPETMRITNVQTGEEVMVVDVKPPQILRVETRGIIVDGSTVLGAALAPGTYAITPLSKDAGRVSVERTVVSSKIATSKPSVQADTPPPQ